MIATLLGNVMLIIVAIAFGIAVGLTVRYLMVRNRGEKDRLMNDIRNSPPVEDGIDDK